MRRTLIIVLLAFGAQACGSKGPLYLPPAKAQPQTQSDLKSKSK